MIDARVKDPAERSRSRARPRRSRRRSWAVTRSAATAFRSARLPRWCWRPAVWRCRALGAPKGGRPQRARVEVRRAAASLHSRSFLQINGGAAPASPATGNPLVDLYQCRDGRWVPLHGGFPHLAANTAPGPCSADGLRARSRSPPRSASWDGPGARGALAEGIGMCGAIARSATEWAAHPQGQALAAIPAGRGDQDRSTPTGSRFPPGRPATRRPPGARPDPRPGWSVQRSDAGRARRRRSWTIALARGCHQPPREHHRNQPRQALRLP